MSFLKKKGIDLSFKTYVVTALSYMALGQFASLITGLIIRTTGEQFDFEILVTVGQMAMDLMGPAIGVAIAYGLNAPALVLFSSAAAGAATVGCSAQMIGFGVSSYRENGIGGLIAQGVGTSILQIANVIKIQ